MGKCDLDWASTWFRIYNSFKNFLFGEQIQKVADSYAGFTGYVWTEAGSAKKKLRIQKYADTCGRGLNLSDCRFIKRFRDFAHRESHIPLARLSVHSYGECHNLLDWRAFPRAIIPKTWTKDFFSKVVLMHQLFLATTVGTWRIWRCFWSPWSIVQSVVGLWGVGTLKRTAGRRLRSTATVMTRDPL